MKSKSYEFYTDLIRIRRLGQIKDYNRRLRNLRKNQIAEFLYYLNAREFSLSQALELLRPLTMEKS